MGDGGVREACLRSMLYIRMPEGVADVRRFELLRHLREGDETSLENFKLMVREQFRMLLLDEITSGLDAPNRNQIDDLLHNQMAGVTTFASTHGHRGIERADIVLVLNQGRLVEAGSPAEVRRRSALFRSLIAL